MQRPETLTAMSGYRAHVQPDPQMVSIDGIAVAVSFDWRPLQSADKSPAQEIKAFSKELGGKKLGVVAKNDEEGVVVVAFAGDQVKKGATAAAAWLAKAVDQGINTVLIEPVDDRTSWVCAIEKGVPHPGFDLIAETAEVDLILTDLTQAKTRPYEIIAPQPIDGWETRLGSFSAIVANTKPVKVTQIVGVQPVIIYSAATLAVLAAAGIGYQQWTSYVAGKEAAARASAERAKQQARAEMSKREMAEAATKRAEKVVADHALGHATTEGQIRAWMAVIRSLPITLRGWDIGGIDCQRNACSVKFSRTRLGTAQSLQDAIFERGLPSPGIVLANEVTIVFPVEPPGPTTAPEELAEKDSFALGLVTNLQRLEFIGLNTSFQPPQQVKVPIAVTEDGKPAEGTEFYTSKFWIGSGTVGGRSLFQVSDIVDFMGSKGISPKRLLMTPGEYNWQMEFNYVAR